MLHHHGMRPRIAVKHPDLRTNEPLDLTAVTLPRYCTGDAARLQTPTLPAMNLRVVLPEERASHRRRAVIPT